MSLEKIREEAIKQFAEKGYNGTSVKDITKAVGITAPALYAHFSSKEELFFNVFEECFSELVEEVKQAIKVGENEGVEKAIYSAYRVYVDQAISLNPKIVLILRNTMFPMEELRDKVVEILKKSNKSSADIIKGMFDKGVREGILLQNSADYYYKKFYKLITGHIYEILAFKIIVPQEQINAEWDEFWNMIKK